MESHIDKMREIYSIPIKYTESWLEMKDHKGFLEYWVVLKTHYMFFFKDQNTHCQDQYVGYINIEVAETKCSSKKGNKDGRCDFMVEMSKKKKFIFRAADDILRRRWIYAIEVVAKAEPPGPLPGDADFREQTVFTPSPSSMKPRARSIAVIDSTRLYHQPNTDTISVRSDSGGSNDLPQRLKVIEERESGAYDPVYVPPSWCLKNCSRNDAVQFLAEQRLGTYLLRNAESSTAEDHYSLSVKDVSRIRHHKIQPVSGGCYFEGAPNAPFPNPTEAVSYLMKTRYVRLKPRPLLSNEVRFSGDGQEDTNKGSKNEEMNKQMSSPVSPTFGGHFLPRPPVASSEAERTRLPSPPDVPSTCSPPSPHLVGKVENDYFHQSQGGSLPAIMKERPLPEDPIYVNREAIIKNCIRPFCDEYVDMKHNIDTDDAPPPLPPKKRPTCIAAADRYVNVSKFNNNTDSTTEYECPVSYFEERQRVQRRVSQP